MSKELYIFLDRSVYGQEIARPLDLFTAHIFKDMGVKYITMKTLLTLQQKGYKVRKNIAGSSFLMSVRARKLFEELERNDYCDKVGQR